MNPQLDGGDDKINSSFEEKIKFVTKQEANVKQN